jgi:hypothetical protein
MLGQRKELQENHKVDHTDHILLETSVVESTNSLYDYSVVLGVQKAVAASSLDLHCIVAWSTSGIRSYQILQFRIVLGKCYFV